MNQREAWEALSDAFEKAKADYYRTLSRVPADERSLNADLQYIEGKFNGLMIARELLAPYLQPK
jgi:hypothetical protein